MSSTVASPTPSTSGVRPPPPAGYTTFNPTSMLIEEELRGLRFAPVMDRLDLGHPQFFLLKTQNMIIAEALNIVDTIRYLRLIITNDSIPILLAIRESVWQSASMISITCSPTLKDELYNTISSLIKANTRLQVLHLHGTKFLSSLAPPSLKRFFYSGEEVERAFGHAVRSEMGLANDTLFQLVGSREYMRRPIGFNAAANGFEDVQKLIRFSGGMDLDDPFFSSYYDLGLDSNEHHHRDGEGDGVVASHSVRLNTFLPRYTITDCTVTGSNVGGILRHQRSSLSVEKFLDGADQELCRGRAEALKKIKIAVLDSGITASHPDLRGAIDDGASFAGGDWQFDWIGHGTHCAGIIAGAQGGIAPGARLYIAKVLKDNNTSGRGSKDSSEAEGGGDLVAGLRWAMDKGVDIISMSVGGDRYDDEVYQVVMEALKRGIIIVAAVGNAGNIKKRNIIFPASIEGIIRVGSHDALGNASPFSAIGGIENDFCALGEKVLSTSHNGAHEYMDGTSMSTPAIAGVCALLLAYDRYLNPEGRHKIKNTHCMKYVLREFSKNNTGDKRMGQGKLELDKAFSFSDYFQGILNDIV